MKKFLLISIFSLPSFLFSQITEGFNGPNITPPWYAFNSFGYNYWKIYSSYTVPTGTILPHSGAGFAGMVKSNSNLSFNESLYLSNIKLSSTGDSVISFWARNPEPDKQILFTVKIGRGNKSIVEYYDLFYNVTAPSEWTLYTATVPAALAGKIVTLEFKTSLPYFNSILGIDDFNMTNAILGVKDIKDSKNFKIYPNPVKDILNLQNDASDSITKLQIFNLVGQLVKKQEGNDITKVDVSDLAKGIYLLKLESKNAPNLDIKFTKE